MVSTVSGHSQAGKVMKSGLNEMNDSVLYRRMDVNDD